MRHRKAGRQFGRNTSHRRAMLRALAANLIAHERIETTDPKAKELRRVAERLITKAKRLGPVAFTPHDKLSLADRARRQAAQAQVGRFLRRFAVIHTGEESRTVDLIEKVFVDLAKRYQSRPGGYTRITKLGRRRGDNAPMVIVELMEEGEGKAEAGKPVEPGKPAEPEKAAEPKAEEGKGEAEPAAAEAAPAAETASAAEAEAAPKKKASRAKKKAEGEAEAEPKAAKKAAPRKKGEAGE